MPRLAPVHLTTRRLPRQSRHWPDKLPLLGLVDETRQAVEETLTLKPDFKVSSFMDTFPKSAETFQEIISVSLTSAGLPE